MRIDVRRRAAPGVLAMLAWAVAAGCGGGPSRVPLFPASGKVLVDGRPAAGVEVRLHPAGAVDSLDALRPFATTEEDGGFTLGTYTRGDGAPEGRYRVTLFWPDRPPGPERPVDRLGGAHARPADSGLEVTITAGPNTIAPFEARGVKEFAPRPLPKRQKPNKDRDGVG